MSGEGNLSFGPAALPPVGGASRLAHSRSIASLTRRTLLIAAAQFGLGACAYRPKPELTYRLTLRLDVGGEACEGSSVIRVVWEERSSFPQPGVRIRPRGWGEAVVIRSRAFGPIFGLLSRIGYDYDYVGAMPTRVLGARLPRELFRRDDGFAPLYELKTVRGRVPLPESEAPALVRFRDLQDIRSAEVVKLNGFPEDGPVVRWAGGFIEVVDAEPTSNLSEWLPGLKAVTNYLSDEDPIHRSSRSKLKKNMFIKEGLVDG